MTYLAFGASTLLQDDGSFFGALFSGFGLLCWLAIIVLVIAGFWKTFQKAGHPGWAAIIPIYNLYIMMKVAGRPGWWIILLLIPFVQFIIWLVVAIDIAKSFGKDTLYGVILLWLFEPIGFLILGFGDAEYIGPSAA